MAQAQRRTRSKATTKPLVGNVKVTRQDWLDAALDVLVTNGVEGVKVLTLADRLAVSRSSFYWYFTSRQDILDALLDLWQQTNTAALVRHAQMPAKTVTEACCNVFRCFVTPHTFDNALDFAVRDWARRSAPVRESLEASDARRINALKAMFERFGYASTESLVRARTLYYMQIGYNDADLREPMDIRLSLVSHYVHVFTGERPTAEEIAGFSAYVEEALAEHER